MLFPLSQGVILPLLLFQPYYESQLFGHSWKLDYFLAVLDRLYLGCRRSLVNIFLLASPLCHNNNNLKPGCLLRHMPTMPLVLNRYVSEINNNLLFWSKYTRKRVVPGGAQSHTSHSLGEHPNHLDHQHYMLFPCLGSFTKSLLIWSPGTLTLNALPSAVT